MGFDQPNKRGADQAGKKGKPARKAAASIQSTAGASMETTASASKPADAAAPSSSSSSLLLQVMPHISSFAAYAVCLLFLHRFFCQPNVSKSGCQRSGALRECVKTLPCCECGHTGAPHVCPPPNAGPTIQHLLLRHSGAVSFDEVMHMCA